MSKESIRTLLNSELPEEYHIGIVGIRKSKNKEMLQELYQEYSSDKMRSYVCQQILKRIRHLSKNPH